MPPLTDTYGDSWIDHDVVAGSAELLATIESLPPTATGALQCGRNGVVLIENRRICWAIAKGMKARLTELLRLQRSPPIEHRFLEEVFRDCKRTGKPLGEALLATGMITERGLRGALLRQTTEAIALIAHKGLIRSRFKEHAQSRYDARFVFSSAEVLASIGACRHQPLAASAMVHLRETLVTDTAGFAFLEGAYLRHLPCVLAVQNLARLGVAELLEVGRWSHDMFDTGRALGDELEILRAGWRSHGAIISWKSGGVIFVAVCPRQSASARLLARLESHVPKLKEATA